MSRRAHRHFLVTPRPELLLRRDDLDPEKLRLGFVVYGGVNRKEWRTASANDVKLDVADFAGRVGVLDF